MEDGAYPCSGELSSGTPASWAGPVRHVRCPPPWPGHLSEPTPFRPLDMALPGGQVGNEGDVETEPRPAGSQPQKGGLLLLCSGPGPRSPFVAGTTGSEVPALAPEGVTPCGQPCTRVTFQPHAAPRQEPRAHMLDPANPTQPPLDHHRIPGCAGVGLLLVLAGRTTLPQVSLQLQVCGVQMTHRCLSTQGSIMGKVSP